MDSVSIQQSLDSIAAFVLRYAVTLAALAALTVALLEAYKKLFGTLARFHQGSVLRWLTEESPTSAAKTQLASTLKAGGHYGVPSSAKAAAFMLQADAGDRETGYDGQKAYADLLHLCTGVRVKEAVPLRGGGPFTRNVTLALFELEIARMMAQIQEAADATLNSPSRYPHLFAFLTRGCEAREREAWIAAMNEPLSPPLSREQLAQIYARIRLLMRRQLDSFQTVTSFRWNEWNQFWAWLVGGILLMAAQLIEGIDHPDTDLTLAAVARMAIVSLAGGILAPIAKDLVSALGKMKPNA